MGRGQVYKAGTRSKLSPCTESEQAPMGQEIGAVGSHPGYIG